MVERARRQEAPDQAENPLVRHSPGDLRHQPIMVDPVEELRQVDIHDMLMAGDDVGLRRRHRLMRRPPRPEAEAVLAERSVPHRLKPLQDRLLDHPIDDGWDAERAFASIRLGDQNPFHRLWTIAPLDKLACDLRPALLKNAGEFFDGHPVHPRRSFVAHDRPRGRLDILKVADRLHQALRSRRAFGFVGRRRRFGLSIERARGFTPALAGQVQRQLDWRSLCGHETSVLFALAFNPSSGTVRAFGQRADLLRPLLTSASRSARLATSSVPKDSDADLLG